MSTRKTQSQNSIRSHGTLLSSLLVQLGVIDKTPAHLLVRECCTFTMIANRGCKLWQPPQVSPTSTLAYNPFTWLLRMAGHVLVTCYMGLLLENAAATYFIRASRAIFMAAGPAGAVAVQFRAGMLQRCVCYW